MFSKNLHPYQWKPVPWSQAWVFTGTGAGFPGKPQGCPWYSLAESDDLNSRLPIRMSRHSWLERGGAVDESSWWIQTGSNAFQVRRYFAHHVSLAPRKMPGSGKMYLWSFGKRYRTSTQEGSSLTAAKALVQVGIDSGAMGRSVINWNLLRALDENF